MTAEKGHIVHINSATGIMGITGSGKSALLGTAAEYVWETHRKISRLYTSDGGGFPTNIQALAQKGIIQIFRMRTRDLPDGSLSFETCLRSTQGWWPARINPATGEVAPGVKMVPPITEQYQMGCPNGHVVKTVPFQSLLTATMCPQCRVMVERSNMQVSKTSHITKGFEQIGAVFFDGLTSMLAWMMSDMSQRSGRLELKGEEGAIGGKINSGDMKIGGSSRSHYGFAQSRSEEMVLNSLGIPNLVVPPVFTALTLETDDEGGLSVRGMKLAGKAKTDEAPAWFGDCLETMVLKSDKDERVYRLCLSEFVDAAGVRHLIKNRASPGTMPAYLEDPPLKIGTEAETAFTNFNLGVFFALRDKALVATEAAMDAKYPDAPGLPDGIVEVGEGTAEGLVPPSGPKAAPAVSPSVPAARGAEVPVGKPSTVPAGSPLEKAKAAAAAAGAAAAPAPPPPATPAPITKVNNTAPAPRPAVPPPVAPKPTPRLAPAATASQPPEKQNAPVAPAPKAVVQAAPAVRQAWAAPAAPRPPAPAPRVGGRK